jgi:hypothetical protein
MSHDPKVSSIPSKYSIFCFKTTLQLKIMIYTCSIKYMNFWLLLFLPLLNTIMRWDEYLYLLNPSYFSCKTGGAVNMTPFPFLLTLIDVLSYFILYSYAFIYNKYISNYLFSIFIIVFTRRYNNYIFPFPLNIKKTHWDSECALIIMLPKLSISGWSVSLLEDKTVS